MEHVVPKDVDQEHTIAVSSPPLPFTQIGAERPDAHHRDNNLQPIITAPANQLRAAPPDRPVIPMRAGSTSDLVSR